jgi:hypothetical protein
MGGLFRRLRRAKEVAPEPSPAPDEEEVSGPPAVPESEPSDVAPPEQSLVPETTEDAGPSAPEVPVGPPPPLPEADRDAARSSIARRRPQSTCFLCGTELDGPWCPTCRMAWSD